MSFVSPASSLSFPPFFLTETSFISASAVFPPNSCFILRLLFPYASLTSYFFVLFL